MENVERDRAVEMAMTMNNAALLGRLLMRRLARVAADEDEKVTTKGAK
jgi:hypothetical protein